MSLSMGQTKESHILPTVSQSLEGLEDILFMMRNSCLALSDPSVAGEMKADGEALLEVRANNKHKNTLILKHRNPECSHSPLLFSCNLTETFHGH